jgi:hypothetical protein
LGRNGRQRRKYEVIFFISPTKLRRFGRIECLQLADPLERFIENLEPNLDERDFAALGFFKTQLYDWAAEQCPPFSK